MERTIWKFPLAMEDEQTVEMPTGAEILTVQAQRGKPCLWAIVDPNAEKTKRTIHTFGTGHPMTRASRRYIGTYQMESGALIFHIFELEE